MAALRRPSGLLIDLSGTIHIENQEIKGSIEAVNQLRKQKIPFLFVTNTSKESQTDLKNRLNEIGFKIDSQEIFTSLTATHNLVKSRNLRPLLLLSESALEDFKDINQENPNAVVIGLAPDHFNYQKLTMAFRLIKEFNAPLIAINKSRYIQTKDGLSLGPGCFISGLEYSASTTAEVVGKPQKSFFLSALAKLNQLYGKTLKPEDVCMIGDDVRDDILGAQNVGFTGCLVKSGKFREGDDDQLSNNKNVSYLFSSFSHAVNKWFEKSE